MKELANEKEIATAIANLKLRDNGYNTFELSSIEKFLIHNKLTASKKFNTYLLEVIAENQQPPKLDELQDYIAIKTLAAEHILDAICYNPNFKFHYKNTNLCTSINNKLASQITYYFTQE